jgi:hypothetical protein
MEWKYTENETPIAYEIGVWDGKRSDEVVVVDDIGRNIIARLYEGTMDGTKFKDWIDSDDYMIEREIIKWLALPE